MEKENQQNWRLNIRSIFLHVFLQSATASGQNTKKTTTYILQVCEATIA